jgi:hypothetical protein
MDNIAGKKSSLTWAVHLSVAALVIIWLIPTLGLLVSSSDVEQISPQVVAGAVSRRTELTCAPHRRNPVQRRVSDRASFRSG